MINDYPYNNPIGDEFFVYLSINDFFRAIQELIEINVSEMLFEKNSEQHYYVRASYLEQIRDSALDMNILACP